MTADWRWRAPLWFGGARRLVLILGFDAVLILLSLYIAYLLRFDGPIPPPSTWRSCGASCRCSW